MENKGLIIRKPISIVEFWQLGREQRHKYESLLFKIFTFIFGPLGINSRIRSGHVLSILNRINLNEIRNVLDAGCGQSEILFWLAKRFPHIRGTGIDFDQKRIVENKKIATKTQSKNLAFEQGDLVNLAHDKSYDVIISMDVLEHINDDHTVVENFRKCLNPGGILILHLPKRNSDAWRFLPMFRRYQTHDHVRPEYSYSEIESLLTISGFKIVSRYDTYGKWGELAFEFNYLFWDKPVIRAILALLTYPISFFFGYLDLKSKNKQGNAFLIIAEPN